MGKIFLDATTVLSILALHLQHEREAAELLGVPDTVTMVALLPVAHVSGGFRPADRKRVTESLGATLLLVVGVVAFGMEGVRMRPTPAFFGMDFLETNVRTYVRAGKATGVYFFSLDDSLSEAELMQ